MAYNSKADLLREKAEAVLKVVRKYENTNPEVYEKFIIGKSTAAIISMNPVTGRPEHNIWAVMETVYEDYRKHPERQINLKLYEVLQNTLRHEIIPTYLHNAIEELLYQLRSEKQGTAPFQLDCSQLIYALRENVCEKRGNLIISGMMKEIKNYDKTLKEYPSVSIL